MPFMPPWRSSDRRAGAVLMMCFVAFAQTKAGKSGFSHRLFQFSSHRGQRRARGAASVVSPPIGEDVFDEFMAINLRVSEVRWRKCTNDFKGFERYHNLLQLTSQWLMLASVIPVSALSARTHSYRYGENKLVLSVR